MGDVASRLRGCAQLTTDGHKPYLSAVEDGFGMDSAYGGAPEIYGAEPGRETRSAQSSA
jgi:hypothetical protein